VHGVYRSPGIVSNINKLRTDFDASRLPNFAAPAIGADVHCVASVLKMYFRQLPQPLFTYHLHDSFMVRLFGSILVCYF
jgi:hypothetical protein